MQRLVSAGHAGAGRSCVPVRRANRRWLRRSARDCRRGTDDGSALLGERSVGCDETPATNEYDSAVREWMERSVLRLGLCPWATQAARAGRVGYKVCTASEPDDVVRGIRAEAVRLSRRGVPALATTLVVCPYVSAWARDFSAFDDWVARNPKLDDLDDIVSLVAFHPHFARWHALAPSTCIGSRVLAHYEEQGGGRSSRPLPAVVVSVDPTVVGVRRIGLRFVDDGVEQWVPTEWLRPPATADDLLHDNWMHRAPYPTIHLIRRPDLSAIRGSEGSYESLAELQLRNSGRVHAHVASRNQADGQLATE
mmetsp:Transcript_103215/g.291453  ORF Transcript_103215/g.291453 Transcript_103215/m.291453 type:complete len:309 (-) Transcript_103215:53-979(-)